jgi:hypothetical protein
MKDTNNIEVGYCRTLGHWNLHGKGETCVDWQARPRTDTDSAIDRADFQRKVSQCQHCFSRFHLTEDCKEGE